VNDDAVSEEPQLEVASFAAHATRGLIRDRALRRRLMFVLTGVALLLVVAGSTLMPISAADHPVFFIGYWFVCGWITLTALLVALFDILMVRRESRAQRKELQRDINVE
jgi:hypothetical protein